MLTDKDRQRIVEQETKAFLDEGFGQLDLSGSPSLQPLPNEKFATSDAKGFNNVQVAGANPLREFASNPDPESLQRLAEETGDSNIAEALRDNREGAVAEEFVRTHPSYYPSDY